MVMRRQQRTKTNGTVMRISSEVPVERHAPEDSAAQQPFQQHCTGCDRACSNLGTCWVPDAEGPCSLPLWDALENSKELHQAAPCCPLAGRGRWFGGAWALHQPTVTGQKYPRKQDVQSGA